MGRGGAHNVVGESAREGREYLPAISERRLDRQEADSVLEASIERRDDAGPRLLHGVITRGVPQVSRNTQDPGE